MNENKKHKSKKTHRLRKGAGTDLITNYDIEQLINFLEAVQENSDLLVYDETYQSLKLITHSHYTHFILKYDWMLNESHKINYKTCDEMMEYLFKDLPQDAELYWEDVSDEL